MAFKMKNPSIAKMAKAAGSNRVAMKMKAESAMKHSEDSAGIKHGQGGHLKPADDVSTRGKAATDFYNKKKSPKKLKDDSAMKLKDKATERAEKRANRSNARKLKRAEKKNEFKSPKKMKKSAMKVHEKGHKENYVDIKQPDGSIKRQYIFGGPDGQKKHDFKPMEKIEELPKKEFKKYDPLPKVEAKKFEAKKASAAKMKRADRLVKKARKMGDKAIKVAGKGNERRSDRIFTRAQKKINKARSIREESSMKHLAMNPGFGTMKELKEHNKDVIAPKGDARKDAKNWTHKKKGKQ